MQNAKGQPTRLALAAHAWGEPVPKTMADARKLAAKGKRLLERYAETKTKKSGVTAKKAGPKKKAPSPKAATKRTSAHKRVGSTGKD